MTRLFLDFETRSRVDLKKHGLSRYVRDPSTKALMLAWAVDNEPVEQVVFAEGQKAPKRLRELLRDPEVVLSAFNARFERLVFKHVLGLDLPVERWRCTMILAMSLALPGSLAKVGDVVDLPEDKKKLARGKLLIRKFSVPRKPTKNKPWTFNDHLTDPSDWREFCDYNRGDVEAERAIYKRLRKWDLPGNEWRRWFLDQRINDAGIPINMRVVRNAIRVAADATAERLAEMADITGLENPNSIDQLLPWLKERGYPFDDLKKGHVRRALDSEQRETPEQNGGDEDLVRVLELRLEVAKSSVKKYDALGNAVDEPENVFRGGLQFAGAGRTMRWAGRRLQAQNLPRPEPDLENYQEGAVRDLEVLDAETLGMLYPDPMAMLATCIRPTIQAPPGYVLIDADYNAIENRVLGWQSEDDEILDVFRLGRDPYIDFATGMFGQSYGDLFHEYKVLKNKEKRTTAKPGVLGCGFGLSAGHQYEDARSGEIEATGLLGYAWNMGIRSFTPEQATLSVQLWRERYCKTVNYWYAMERAAKRCVTTGRSQEIGPCEFNMSGPFLRLRLPSGRHIHYCRPAIRDVRMSWGDTKRSLTYEGIDDKKRWARISTFYGKLVENATQAIARDILAHGLDVATAAGLDVRFHVHDQIIALVREDVAEEKLALLQECMSEQPAWAKGLPLRAEGFISPVFLKD